MSGSEVCEGGSEHPVLQMIGPDRPETSYDSKKVMMRAEEGDTIRVETLGRCEVSRRHGTYFGPKLWIKTEEDDGELYILHATGPERELQLRDAAGEPLRIVPAGLVDTKQYDICTECGEPLKNVEHRRRSLIGACGTDTDLPEADQ